MSIPFSIQDIISRDEETNDLDNVTVCSKVALEDERTVTTDGRHGPDGWVAK